MTIMAKSARTAKGPDRGAAVGALSGQAPERSRCGCGSLTGSGDHPVDHRRLARERSRCARATCRSARRCARWAATTRRDRSWRRSSS